MELTDLLKKGKWTVLEDVLIKQVDEYLAIVGTPAMSGQRNRAITAALIENYLERVESKGDIELRKLAGKYFDTLDFHSSSHNINITQMASFCMAVKGILITRLDGGVPR